MKNVRTRNHVQIFGQGEKTIMLAHGFGCDQTMWRYITPHLMEQYTIVLFDYVGSGHSDSTSYESLKYSSLHGYKQDILDIIDEMELESIVFIGHSVSSIIGMLVAIEQPERFEKIIMIGPSPCYINVDEYKGGFEQSDISELLYMMEMNFIGWASYMAPLAMDHTNGPKLANDLENSFLSMDPQIAREFAEVTFLSDFRSSVSSLRTPTLIIQCSHDSIVPIEVGEYLNRNIPNSTLEIVEAKGHFPHISHPVETSNLIKQFLEEKVEERL